MMNTVMIVSEIDDVDRLGSLKQYFDVVDDFRITVLYISDPQEGLCLDAGTHAHYILPDAELVFKQELEEHVSHVFLHWLDRVKFRHEVGNRSVVIDRVIREEHADIVAVCRNRCDEDLLASLGTHRVLFDDTRLDLPLATSQP
ncbi:hypothetical protein Heshes_13310 [Alicyclobacillus hesperidum]|uniref:Uncharacterized protein n=2 Tax=Alicyclobacillus hesperidum TaxID=89784 RepID=A0AA37U8C8_9BACL|nr:hypothetical protein Heshes_13310 [Alicyclobacillus hesperidum]